MKRSSFVYMAVVLLCGAAASVSAQTNTWTRINAGIDDSFKGVCFPTPERGYVVGDGGVLHSTTDGGAHWTETELPVQKGLWGVYAVPGSSGDIIYLAGDDGTMLKSIDGGAHWSQQDIKYNQGFTFGVFGLDKDHCWVTGGEGEPGSTTGVIVRTTDGGTTWTKTVLNDVYSFDKSYFINPMVGYAVGTTEADFSHGVIYQTTDGGAVWKKSTETNGGMNSVHAFDADNAIAVGFGGVIVRTTDGGQSWYGANVPPQFSANIFTHVSFLDNKFGYIAGPGVVLKSTDGGATWSNESSMSQAAILWGMSVTSGPIEGGGTFYTVGDVGAIYKLAFAPPAGPSVLLEPSQIAFGDVQIGAKPVRQFHLNGTHLSGTVTLHAPPGFLLMLDENEEPGQNELMLSPETNGTLSWDLYMRFAPTVAGDASGVLRITGENLDQTVPVSGRGIATTGVERTENAMFMNVLPNPLAGHGTIALGLLARAHVGLRLYDALGREVMPVASGDLEAGRHDIPFQTSGLANGVYRLRLELNGAPSRELPVVIVR